MELCVGEVDRVLRGLRPFPPIPGSSAMKLFVLEHYGIEYPKVTTAPTQQTLELFGQ